MLLLRVIFALFICLFIYYYLFYEITETLVYGFSSITSTSSWREKTFDLLSEIKETVLFQRSLTMTVDQKFM